MCCGISKAKNKKHSVRLGWLVAPAVGFGPGDDAVKGTRSAVRVRDGRDSVSVCLLLDHRLLMPGYAFFPSLSLSLSSPHSVTVRRCLIRPEIVYRS